MIFAKVDVTLPQHHRVLRIPRDRRAAALGVWLVALCYTRGNELDGFVPGEAIDLVASKRVLEDLVGVGLLSADEKDGVHGYLLLRYAEHNETKEVVQRRRNATNARVQKHRCNAVTNTEVTRTKLGSVPDSDSDSDSVSGSGSSDLISEGVQGERESGVRRASNATADGAFGGTVDSWVGGIRSVTGADFPPPRGKAAGRLAEALARSVGPNPPGDPCEAAREAGRAYAAANPGRTLDVFDFERWLGSGKPDRSGPRSAAPPQPPPAGGRVWKAGGT